MDLRTCTKCNTPKLLNKFCKDRQKADGISCWCSDCRTENKRHRDKSFPEQAYKRGRDYQLRRSFGINLVAYNKLFSEYEGKCAICEAHQAQLKKALAVDHNHETGEIRGLLCDKCNRGLGFFNDNCSLISNAQNYLNKFSVLAANNTNMTSKVSEKVG